MTFPCAGETLVGTLDDAPGHTGLIIVSGGNEIRAGAHRGMAQLAAQLASDGTPVFRFDRRGVGDSTGHNGGFRSARPDIEAAMLAFRQTAPHVKRLVAFGNCDAASALLLFDVGFQALVLANPWIGGDQDGLPPVDAIKARYGEAAKDPGTWARALTGGVNFRKLASGLGKVAAAAIEKRPDLEADLVAALRKHPAAQVLIATGDATGIAFTMAAERAELAQRLTHIDTDSHSFARATDKEQLVQALREAIAAA